VGLEEGDSFVAKVSGSVENNWNKRGGGGEDANVLVLVPFFGHLFRHEFAGRIFQKRNASGVENSDV
jgi:hypothetical protein